VGRERCRGARRLPDLHRRRRALVFDVRLGGGDTGDRRVPLGPRRCRGGSVRTGPSGATGRRARARGAHSLRRPCRQRPRACASFCHRRTARRSRSKPIAGAACWQGVFATDRPSPRVPERWADRSPSFLQGSAGVTAPGDPRSRISRARVRLRHCCRARDLPIPSRPSRLSSRSRDHGRMPCSRAPRAGSSSSADSWKTS